ncbi:MAG: DM13 domain-containing protein [Geminicoccaceae bacterium]
MEAFTAIAAGYRNPSQSIFQTRIADPYLRITGNDTAKTKEFGMFRKYLAIAVLSATITAGALAASAEDNRIGEFTGASDHVASGQVLIEEDANGRIVRLGTDFFLDGAPDPKIGFGVDGQFVEGTLIGALQSNAGEQVYRIPSDLDASGFTDVILWCEQFAVPLGQATLR